jgi:fibronectin type III domain protein
MHRTTGGARRGRRAGLLLCAAAVVLLPACTPAASPVEVAAATAAAPRIPWTDSAPRPGTGYPDLPLAAPATGGMPVPQPPRPTGVHRLPTARAAVGTAPSLTPRTPSCGGFVAPHRIGPGVQPGAGSATVSWMAGGRAEVQGYRISAVSQLLVSGSQPAPRSVTVASPAGCAPVTATVTGLVPGTPYVFWLEEQTVDPVTTVVRFVQVGTSDAVVIGG